MSIKIPHKKPETNTADWKNTTDRGSPWLIDVIIWIILNMGRSIGRLFLYPIVLYFILTSSTRRFSWQYLQRNFKTANKQAPDFSDLFKHYYSFANMLLDRVYFLTGKHQKFNITLHNAELINNLVAQNKGAVLLGSHLGNFDALRALAGLRDDIKIRALMYNNEQQNINLAFEKLNPSLKQDVIYIGTPEAMIKVQEDLDKGYLIGMLADRIEQEDRSTLCHFLGHEACFPTGPLIVSHILKAPVILCFALHRCKNEYDVFFHLFDEQIQLPRKDREQSLQKMMQRYADILEQHAISYPYNWYNYYDFWKDYA